MRLYLPILTILISMLQGQTNLETLFATGNRYYEMEKYAEAIAVYKQLSENVEHANLYYNLGNAYYRVGDIGQAIWSFEKGRASSPRHKDLLHNLAIANAQVRDRIEPPEGFFPVMIYRAVLEKLTVMDLLSTGSLLILLLSLLFMIRAGRTSSIKFVNSMKILMVILILSTHFLALDRYWDLSDTREGIVIASASDVRSGPVARGENVVFRVHEGTKLEITQTQPGWLEIILLDGKKGWLQSSDVRKL